MDIQSEIATAESRIQAAGLSVAKFLRSRRPDGKPVAAPWSWQRWKNGRRPTARMWAHVLAALAELEPTPKANVQCGDPVPSREPPDETLTKV